MKILTPEQILILHKDLMEQSGGLCGIRDKIFSTQQSMHHFNLLTDRIYTTLLEKAARLGYGLINNHPFIDGNKRTGTHAMLVFLGVNQVFLEYDDAALIETILRVAAGTLNEKHLLAWLQEHITP